MFKITCSNTKLGTICSANLPAVITCRPDAPCTHLCYATHGNFIFKNVKQCYQNNLQAFIDNPAQAEEDILNQLPAQGFMRWHASGDILNERYLEMMVSIANKVPNVKFMCFTKKYELVNDYIWSTDYKIPDNLKIIFSVWHGLNCPNFYELPTAIVNLKAVHDNRIQADAYPCGGKCDKCFICWKLGSGEQVIFNQH